MADEDGSRARRAADVPADAPTSRPKRFVTPDWDDWDSDSGSSPDTATDSPKTRAPGGRFASEESEPEISVGPARPAPQPPVAAAARPARHAWDDEASPGPADATQEQAVVPPTAQTPVVTPVSAAGRVDWRPIPADPSTGAARAAQSPSLGDKRRREAPALPTTPPPRSPEERRDALIARERAGRSVAPGTRPQDDWTGAPLPASAVPPPAIGQAPPAIVVQDGEAPVAHRAYSRPSGEAEDEDTLWLTRRPTSRAAEAAGIATPVSVVTAPPTGAPQPVAVPPAPVTLPPAPVALPQGPEVPQLPAASVTAPATQSYGPVPALDPIPGTAAEVSAAPTAAASAGVTPPAGPPATEDPATGRVPLWKRPSVLIGAAAVVLVIALVAGLLIWMNRSKTPTATNSASTTALVDRLVTPTQLDALGLGQWTEQKTEPTVTQDSSAPLCFVAAPDLPTPQAQVQRKLTATGASVLHRISQYATSADATQVYALRLTQLGACSNIPAYLVSGAKVTSLGDDAVGITAVIQDQTAQFHTVVLVRTGSAVITYDVAQAGALVPYEKVLPLAATTVAAVCSSSGGSCTASPAATAGVPPNTSVPGWLAVSDLPRVTVGMGRWNAPAPKTSVTSAGSACENVTFATVAGPNQRRQRTYLLTEDTKAPKNFGLDEILLDFDTPEAATAFVTSLKSAIDSCPTRTPTAKLGTEGAITAAGANGEAITGFWRSLSQSTNPTTTYNFRLGVTVVGSRVVYLLANPSTTYDYADADWSALTARAGQRATQGG